MALFEQVEASLPQEGVLAHSQARMREIRAKVYPKPAPYKEPEKIEADIIQEPYNVTIPPYDADTFNRWLETIRGQLKYNRQNKLKKNKTENSALLILQEVSILTGVSIDEMSSYRRSKQISYARYIYYYRTKTELGLGTSEIGKVVNADHSAAHYGIKRYTEIFGNNTHAKRMEQGGNK